MAKKNENINGADLGEVRTIREILFGDLKRNYDNQLTEIRDELEELKKGFSRMEKEYRSSSTNLENDFLSRMNMLEGLIQSLGEEMETKLSTHHRDERDNMADLLESMVGKLRQQ